MKKWLVIFDLNGVMISRKYAKGEFVSNFPDGAFVLDNHLIWIRPGLDELFDYAFEHFEVAVWSSMQETNINKILPYVFKDRKLYFVWSQKHCWACRAPCGIHGFWSCSRTRISPSRREWKT